MRRRSKMNYKVIDQETYYRKGVFRHFTEDCKCSTSMTTRIDVTELVASSKASGTKFYINFLYLLAKVLNSLNIELPDGYLYFLPIVNWGKYREENGRLVMPITVRINHAVADGFLIANVFRLLDKEIAEFCR